MKRIGRVRGTLLLGCGLLGCVTIRDPAAPYSLSDADRAIVGKALYAKMEKLDSPEFTGFRGVQTADGKIYVCGWVSDRGAYSDKPPFIGTLFAGQFVIDHLGKSYAERDYVVSECKELGIPLN
jgi:hypothetical protein